MNKLRIFIRKKRNFVLQKKAAKLFALTLTSALAAGCGELPELEKSVQTFYETQVKDNRETLENKIENAKSFEELVAAVDALYDNDYTFSSSGEVVIIDDEDIYVSSNTDLEEKEEVISSTEVKQEETTVSNEFFETEVKEEKTDNSIKNTESDKKETVSVPKSSLSKVPYTDMDNAIIGSTVRFTSSEKGSLVLTINGTDNYYPYSEYYGTKDALKRYEKMNYNPSSSNVIVNGVVDYDKLYNTVIKNNAEYLSEPNHGRYTELEDISNICHYVCDSINDELNSTNYINVGQLDQKISDLKILGSSSFGNASYSQVDGMIGVSPGVFKKDESFLKKIIVHESKHLIQANSKEEQEIYGYEYRFGTNTKYNDVAVNTLKWDWYFEACADSLTIKHGEYSVEDCSYKAGVKYLYMFKMANLDASNTLESLTFQSDINEIFNYFGCSSQEEKEELVNMFFAINIILKDDNMSSVNEFKNYYKEKTGTNFDNSSKFKDELKGYIGITSSKIFYRNLANELANKDVNVNELFTVISSFENELSCNTFYSSKAEQLKEFYNDYESIQSTFFSLIASKLGVNESEVRDAYIAFNKNNDNYLSDSFLGDTFDSFLNKETNRIVVNKREAITVNYDKLKKNHSL